MFLREWGIFAVRCLVLDHPINQAAVDALVPQVTVARVHIDLSIALIISLLYVVLILVLVALLTVYSNQTGH